MESNRFSGPWVIYEDNKVLESSGSEEHAKRTVDMLNNRSKQLTLTYKYTYAYVQNYEMLPEVQAEKKR